MSVFVSHSRFSSRCLPIWSMALLLLACTWPAAARPTTTVVWISVDGLRAADLMAAEAPFLQGLAREGAFSLRVDPGFPSVTFTGHVTQATGAAVAVHGIPANHFLDRQSGTRWSYPGDPGLLQAEPIWTTATRQGRRTAVFDWPLAQAQRGPWAAAYFGEAYVRGRGDRARLQILLDAWRADTASPPLRLLMAYLPSVDGAGHRHGPGSPEVLAAIARVDRQLARVQREVLTLFESRRRAADEALVFMVTSDHGMTAVTHRLDARRVLGLARGDGSEVIASGSVAQLYLPAGLNAAQREQRLRAAETAVAREPLARAWRPEERGDHPPTRSGDLLVSLQPGAVFARPDSGLRGAHGYALAESPDMAAIWLLQRYPNPYRGHDLGAVDARQIHPTVARLLEIEPAPTARAAALILP